MDDTSPSVETELSIPDLAARITELAGHLNSANHRWLRLGSPSSTAATAGRMAAHAPVPTGSAGSAASIWALPVRRSASPARSSRFR